MYLLRSVNQALIPLDDLIKRVPHFPVNMNKRDVVGLMEHLEELNARLVEDVNNGEQELMMRDSSSSAIEKKEVQQKIKVTDETVKAMEKRLIELRAHNDVLMAPKRDQIAAE